MKLAQNIKFSTEITYRSVIFIENYQNEDFNEKCKIIKITDFNEIGGKYQIFH